MNIENKILEQIQKSLNTLSNEGLLRFTRGLLSDAWQSEDIRLRILERMVIIIPDLEPQPIEEQKKRGRKPKEEAKIEEPQPQKAVLNDEEAILKDLYSEINSITEADDDNLGAMLDA